MNVPVLPTAVVNAVFRHGNFRAVEHGRLVHVVPYVDVVGCPGEFVQGVQAGIVLAHRRVKKVQITARPGPTPS